MLGGGNEEVMETMDEEFSYKVSESGQLTTTGKPPCKLYIGWRHSNPHKFAEKSVWVVEKDGSVHLLEHHNWHSSDGFEWSYSGSGPADLALALAWDMWGRQWALVHHQDLKVAFVQGLPEYAWMMTAIGLTLWRANFQRGCGCEVCGGVPWVS